MPFPNKNIKVSVVVITHNHEKYIYKTLQSIVTQQTDFDFEIIVYDDASNDNSQGIISGLAAEYTGKITLIKGETNIGPFKSAHKAFLACKGNYMAWLDGDDYWCFPNKLQKQCDFLEKNPSYAGCFHDAKIISQIPQNQNPAETGVYHNSWKYYSQFNCYKPDFFPWDLLERNLIATASLLFRKEALHPSFFDTSDNLQLSLNWFLHLHIIKESRFRYFNEVWSVYMDHSEGISKRLPQEDFKISNINYLKSLTSDLYYVSMRKDIYAALCKEYYQLLHIQKKKKDIKLSHLMSYYLYSFKKLIAETFSLLGRA